MSEHIVQDWLVDCASLSPVELHSLANSIKYNDEVISALYDVLETRQMKIVNDVCKQLFTFYRSREVELQRFTLQFLPSFIYIYLNAVAARKKNTCSSVETLLIGIYNLEVVDENGEPVTISFRLPSLAQASIYHEPMNLAHASLTEAALRRLEECNVKLVSWGPLPQVEIVNAQNRMKVVTGLMFVYNRHIASLHKSSLEHLCKMSSRLVSQGFNKWKKEGMNDRPLPRIPVSSQFILELLSGLYFAMYNDCGYSALEAVEDIYNRSCFECYAEGLIVANAIKNSCHVTPSGKPREGPMGISLALSPATTTVTQVISKSMITNASFRTKKLPDDIPIIPKEESSGGGGAEKNLSSITEERDTEESTGFAARGTSMRGKDAVTKNLQKLGIGKKFKEVKAGKSGSGGGSTGAGGKDEKRQSLQLSTLKEKVTTTIKSPPVVQNGDFAQDGIDGHSPVPRKNAPEIGKETGMSFINEGQVLLTGGDADELEETVICLENSPNARRKFDDKPIMQVSSV